MINVTTEYFYKKYNYINIAYFIIILKVLIFLNKYMLHISQTEEPHTILKRQVSRLSKAISNPDRLATDMWSNDLISDVFKDMLNTRDLSRLDKNDKLLTEMHRHLENSSCSQQLLGTFCSVLKGQGDPTLNQIAYDMVKCSD